VTVIDYSTITATAPAHAAGAVEVVVANPDGQRLVLPGGFVYADTIYQYYLPAIQ
jgi:hypothetical protein